MWPYSEHVFLLDHLSHTGYILQPYFRICTFISCVLYALKINCA